MLKKQPCVLEHGGRVSGYFFFLCEDQKSLQGLGMLVFFRGPVRKKATTRINGWGGLASGIWCGICSRTRPSFHTASEPNASLAGGRGGGDWDWRGLTGTVSATVTGGLWLAPQLAANLQPTGPRINATTSGATRYRNQHPKFRDSHWVSLSGSVVLRTPRNTTPGWPTDRSAESQSKH